MISRTSQFYRVIGLGIENLRGGSPWTFGTNHIIKRYAGHSQYANRKHAKEESSLRRAEMIRRYQFKINRIIRSTKDPNLETNSKLKAVFGEAMKNNVPKATLEKAVKIMASALNHDSIHHFTCAGPFGITGMIEVSSIQPEAIKCQLGAVIRKFGFQISNNAAVGITSVGVITCKPSENVQNYFDKAVEDAIFANCEDVKETDDNYIEFQCHSHEMDLCAKKLSDLGYSVENSETKHIFPELIKMDDETVLERLNKMEEKLQFITGFVRISYNFE